MIHFETATRINRPVDDVFAFVADGRNAARWNSAVKSVEKLSEGPAGVGATYFMVRDLPGRRAENKIEVTEYIPNERYAIRTTSGPTPFTYRYLFDAVDDGSATRIVLDAEADLGLANVLGPLASVAVRRGVDENLQTLKRLLEADGG